MQWGWRRLACTALIATRNVQPPASHCIAMVFNDGFVQPFPACMRTVLCCRYCHGTSCSDRCGKTMRAGPSDGAAGSDAPWAGGSSVFALLQQEVPKPVRAAGAALTGALAAPAADGKKEKKAKKEKKGKKEKKEKRKHEVSGVAVLQHVCCSSALTSIPCAQCWWCGCFMQAGRQGEEEQEEVEG